MKVQQEPDRLPRKRLLGVTVATVLATAAGVTAAWLVASCRADELGGREVLRERVLPVPDEVNAMEMNRFDERRTMLPPARTRDRAALDRWQWADPKKKLVRPPIDAAMDLYLSREKEETP